MKKCLCPIPCVESNEDNRPVWNAKQKKTRPAHLFSHGEKKPYKKLLDDYRKKRLREYPPIHSISVFHSLAWRERLCSISSRRTKILVPLRRKQIVPMFMKRKSSTEPILCPSKERSARKESPRIVVYHHKVWAEHRLPIRIHRSTRICRS